MERSAHIAPISARHPVGARVPRPADNWHGRDRAHVERLGILGLIIVIRTFLTFSLQNEIEGRLP
jgi:hypothetical protein